MRTLRIVFYLFLVQSLLLNPVYAEKDGRSAKADKWPPVIIVPGAIEIEASASWGAVVDYEARAIDRVDGSVDVACSPISGSQFSLSDTLVSCRAQDKKGNVSHSSFVVSVIDSTSPTMSLPTNIEIDSSLGAPVLVNYTVAVSDLVDTNVSYNCVPASGSMFSVGSTDVVCSASDGFSNTVNGSFKVSINDIPPELPLNPPSASFVIPANDIELVVGESLSVVIDAVAKNSNGEHVKEYTIVSLLAANIYVAIGAVDTQGNMSDFTEVIEVNLL